MGDFLALVLVASGLLAGGAMYYLQVYGFYQTVDVRPGQDVVLLPLGSDAFVLTEAGGYQAA